jgi:hypothetical protein
MKRDVLALARLERTEKRPSKETLNHAGIVHLASGLDPFTRTPEAYLRAYAALGIDIVNRVPEESAPPPLEPGEVRDLGNGYREAYLGIYGTLSRIAYPWRDADEFRQSGRFRPDYGALITPVPHRLEAGEIRRRMAALGEVGLYYYMLYTTLFMWGVEALGWDVFLTAAVLDPSGFDEQFLEPAFQESRRLLAELAEVDSPFVFCHDDLADAKGPVFPPAWYEKHVFPRYRELWRPLKERGRQVIFVADGNMSAFLEPLRAAGADGVMLENPATPLESILRVFGDRIVIGGIETGLLTRGSPAEVRRHVAEVHARTEGMAGFVLSTPGGIHGNIPLENLEAYFDARVLTGHTPPGWRAAADG